MEQLDKEFVDTVVSLFLTDILARFEPEGFHEFAYQMYVDGEMWDILEAAGYSEEDLNRATDIEWSVIKERLGF